MVLHGLINKEVKNNVQMGWELELFKSMRSLDDGLSVFEIKCDFSWYNGDHQPSYEFSLVMFNYTIFGLTIYNTQHIKEDDA